MKTLTSSLSEVSSRIVWNITKHIRRMKTRKKERERQHRRI
uniref:Uncharacterized protein n=1 Tax=Firmicutes phage HS18 TaxID=3056396 RepID=A0AA49X4C2_9VIRU|nr:MAG: hypothetical protein [Firmicutes phage HS18]